MLLEVCVDSYPSAMAAIAGDADRLELCSALAVGGLTPSFALLRQIRQVSSIPIRCLMRPRAGDFLYTPEEIRQMAMEIELLRASGADGFVDEGQFLIQQNLLALGQFDFMVGQPARLRDYAIEAGERGKG